MLARFPAETVCDSLSRVQRRWRKVSKEAAFLPKFPFQKRQAVVGEARSLAVRSLSQQANRLGAQRHLIVSELSRSEVFSKNHSLALWKALRRKSPEQSVEFCRQTVRSGAAAAKWKSPSGLGASANRLADRHYLYISINDFERRTTLSLAACSIIFQPSSSRMPNWERLNECYSCD